MSPCQPISLIMVCTVFHLLICNCVELLKSFLFVLQRHMCLCVFQSVEYLSLKYSSCFFFLTSVLLPVFCQAQISCILFNHCYRWSMRCSELVLYIQSNLALCRCNINQSTCLMIGEGPHWLVVKSSSGTCLGWCACSQAVFFFCCFLKLSQHLLLLFRRTLQRCFAANLQKCFVVYKTSPSFPSAWGETVANDWIFIFGRTDPF